MMCASASLAVEMWLMFVTGPRFLNVVRMESLNESYTCDSPAGKQFQLGVRLRRHAGLLVERAPERRGVHAVVRAVEQLLSVFFLQVADGFRHRLRCDVLRAGGR